MLTISQKLRGPSPLDLATKDLRQPLSRPVAQASSLAVGHNVSLQAMTTRAAAIIKAASLYSLVRGCCGELICASEIFQRSALTGSRQRHGQPNGRESDASEPDLAHISPFAFTINRFSWSWMLVPDKCSSTRSNRSRPSVFLMSAMERCRPSAASSSARSIVVAGVTSIPLKDHRLILSRPNSLQSETLSTSAARCLGPVKLARHTNRGTDRP